MQEFGIAVKIAVVFHLILLALGFIEGLIPILSLFVAPGFAMLKANGVGTREFPGPLIGLAFNLLIYSLVLWPIVSALRSRKERLERESSLGK